MNRDLLIEIRTTLNKLIKSGELEKKNVVVFGANHPGDYVINYLNQQGIEVNAVIDNNPLNAGKKLMEVCIDKPENILGNYKDDTIVLICSKYYVEMRSQLENMGYTSKHIVKLVEMSAQTQGGLDNSLFETATADIYKGFEIYEALKKKYGDDCFIFINPVKANGDIYMSCLYLEQYLNSKAISNYAFVVVGEVCRSIAKLFGVKNIETLSQHEIQLLSSLERVACENDLKVLQPFWQYTSILHNLDGYNGINFDVYYKSCIYGLNENTSKSLPVFEYDEQYIASLFNEKKLKKGKTVILSPFANSLPSLPWSFFERLAQKLIEMGYSVCTNSAGDDEPVIKGTVPIFFSFKHAAPVLEYAQYFVGMRSGLCEIISSANCKKIILYPDKCYKFSSVKSLYSLEQLGDVIEMVYDRSVDQMVDDVIKKL